MIQILKKLLIQIVNDIDCGNSNILEKEQDEILKFIQKINSKQLSKSEASVYIGVSTSTFDNYVRKGFIPKGEKRQGWKELSWNKYDLDEFLKNGTLIWKKSR